MSNYPEHEKLREHNDLPYDLVDFLDWLHDKGYVLAEEHIGGEYDQYTELRETEISHLDLVYTYLVINEAALLQETKEILRKLKERQHEHHD